MFIFTKKMRYYLLHIILFLSFIGSTFAEGTKQLRPTSGDFGDVEIGDGSTGANPLGRPFARTDNTDTLQRLYIHVSSTSEKIYFGFQPTTKTLGKGKFRIKDPNGNIVYALTNVPIAAGAGYIDTYAQAVAGPKIGGSPAAGYNPFSLTPTTTGDYYIEFEETVTTGNGTYYFDYFDITVVNASSTPILGRLWSYSWDLSTRGGTNKMKTVFYIYSKDKYVSSVNMNEIQPFGFVISSNSTGTAKSGDLFTDRQSVSGNHTYPEYKIFLNTPDPTVYDVASQPTMIEDLKVLGTPIAESEVLFYLNMNKAGTLEIFLDLDNNPGYQPNNQDVVLVKTIKANGDTIHWDAKDGLGNFVTNSVIVSVSSRFSTGVTHIPLYDPETHAKGFIVNRISPSSERASLYWDDSQLPSLLGTVQFDGVSGDADGHNFPDTTGGFGNNRTINTWWNGFENNDLKSFAFTMDGTTLPIELSKWEAINKGSYVQLSWTTLSEKDNQYFDIERSLDGKDWEVVNTVMGAGTSNSIIHYSELDESPLLEISYYRLKQVDINSNFSYSEVSIINRSSIQEGYIDVSYNKNYEIVTLEGLDISSKDMIIRNTAGVSVNNNILFTQISSSKIQITISSLPDGMYIIQSPNYYHVFYKK